MKTKIFSIFNTGTVMYCHEVDQRKNEAAICRRLTAWRQQNS